MALPKGFTPTEDRDGRGGKAAGFLRHFRRGTAKDRDGLPASSFRPVDTDIRVGPGKAISTSIDFMATAARRKDVSQADIGEFISGLRGEWSAEKQAFSARFIEAHREEIEAYLRNKVSAHLSASSAEWQKNVRSLLSRYGTMPKGYTMSSCTAA